MKLRSGVNVPGLRMVDAPAGLLAIEWIEGKNVKNILAGGAYDDEMDEELVSASSELKDSPDPLKDFGISSGMYDMSITFLHADSRRSLDELLRLIGTEIAKMHKADIIHGDLTTSNMMLRYPSSLHSSGPNSLVRLH